MGAKFSEIINQDKPVLVDFYAEWCGPCKMMPPVLKEIKDCLGDRITILKIDVDKNPALASEYNVRSVPTLILFQDGDLEYFPKDINKLFEKIKNGDDIVFGNRFHKISHYHYKTFAIANFFISKFISILYSFKISDAAVCYKMFKKNVIEQTTINSKDFMFDFEFVSKVLKKNIWKISEVDISYKGRTFKEGKKISWVDGFRALLVILKVKLFY